MGEAFVSAPRAILVQKLGRALATARRGVTGFERRRHANDAVDYYDSEADTDLSRDLQLTDIAILLDVVASSDAASELAPSIAALDALLLPLARSARAACRLALYPAIGPGLALPHILLGRRDHADPQFDRLLGESLGARAARGRELAPHHRLECLWQVAMWSGTAPGPGFDAAAAESVLAHPLDLIWGAEGDAAAFTRAVRWFTDFGRHFGAAPRPLPRPATAILGDAEAVLARALVFEDFDLAAETLMLWPQLGRPFAPGAAFAFDLLAELEDTAGFQRRRTARHHSSCALALLWALALRPPLAIARSGAAPAAPAAPAALIEALLAAAATADTAWRSGIARLDPAARARLAPFLLDMALLATARAQNFAGVARLLDLATDHGLADRPLCLQAVQLLQRMAIAVTG